MGRKIVSKGEYTARKTLAVSLSGSLLACGVGVALLLASLPYASYLDAKTEAQARIQQGWPPDYQGDLDLLYSYLGWAEWLCLIFIPILLLGALLLWIGSRKSWKTVRTMQPINYTNTADLPGADSLVRASSEPTQAQEAVLLRAAAEGQETPSEELVRASVGIE